MAQRQQRWTAVAAMLITYALVYLLALLLVRYQVPYRFAYVMLVAATGLAISMTWLFILRFTDRSTFPELPWFVKFRAIMATILSIILIVTVKLNLFAQDPSRPYGGVLQALSDVAVGWFTFFWVTWAIYGHYRNKRITAGEQSIDR